MSTLDLESIDPEVLQDYEEMFIAAYQELYPEYEWSYGSLLYEVVVRPTAIRAASDEEDLETLRENSSLYLASIAETPDPDLVASLASNFRVDPKEGINGTGEITVYSRQQNNVYIPALSELSAGGIELTNDKTYVGVQNADDYVDKEDTVYRQLVQVGTEWAFTVPVRTVEFTDETVAQGLTVTMVSRPSQVSRIEVSTSVTGGRAEQSTDEIIEQAQTGLTAKIPSGNTHLSALFADQSGVNILSQVSFGINDPECIRDRDNVFEISTGGRVDTYCRNSDVPTKRTVSIPASRSSLSDPWRMFIDKDTGLGFYRILCIQHADSALKVTDENEMIVDYGYAEVDNGPHVFSADTARYSIYQTAHVEFDYEITETETTFVVELLAMPQLETLQEFINQDSIRNEAQDVLVRGPHPGDVSITVTVERVPGDTSTTVEQLQNAIATLINATEIGVDGLDASLIVNAVEGVDASLHVVFPITLEVAFQLPDGTIITERSLEGRITVPESEYEWVTERNTFYFCTANNMTVELRDRA
jgi:hypothetical protein